MEHLSLDTLARLVDEAPTPEEREHLASCEECVLELDAMREQTSALGGLPDVRPPRGDWAILEARMVSEGLVQGRGGFQALARTPDWMKTAAAIVLFLGGTGLGVALGDSPALQNAVSPAEVGGPAAFASMEASNVDEAAATVRRAERAYIDALVQFRQLSADQDPTSTGINPDQRMAALEYLVSASQAAVQQAPADPFMNGLLASLNAELQTTRRASLQSARQSSWW